MRVVLAAFQPDIVWNHSLWIDTDVMIWTGFHPQVTVPYGYNEVETLPGRARIRRRIYDESDAFVDGLPEFRRYFMEKEGVAREKFPPQTLYSGVPHLRKIREAGRRSGQDLRTRYDIPADAVVLLESRGLRHRSGGALDAIRALHLVRARGVNAHLILVAGLLGNDAVGTEADALARKLGVRDWVTLVRGDLSVEELLPYYSAADIYLSLLPSDALGKSIMEAAAAGCLLVLTDLPNYRPAFGNHAEYVSPGASHEVAGAIQRCVSLTDPERRVRIDANQRWLSEHQDYDTACDRLLEYFDTIVTTRQKRRSSR